MREFRRRPRVGDILMLEKIKQRQWTRKERFLILSFVPLYFMIAGLFLQKPSHILIGLYNIVVEPDFLITDYMMIGGIGAAFMNAGILTLFCIWTIYFLGMEMDGHTITSSFLMFGFSLFGKNVLNIWTILLGVFLYAYYHKAPLTKYIYVGFYGTSLSPIISQMMQLGELPPLARFLLMLFLGMLIGFMLPPLSTHVHFAHRGYSLYNVGFAGGIIATVIVSVMKSFNIKIQSRLIWYEGGNVTFMILLGLLFLLMILSGLLMHPKKTLQEYLRILKSPGLAGTDYLKNEGMAATLVNMGINGIFASAFLVLAGGDLNGPTIGGIMTIVGFSSTGKHIRSITPVMLGVYCSSLIMNWDITDASAQLALLFSTTLAPVAGKFGVIPGMLAGFLHASVALNVGIVYGGMNLYNNGFAGGLVAIFMVPVIQSIEDRIARAREGISL